MELNYLLKAIKKFNEYFDINATQADINENLEEKSFKYLFRQKNFFFNVNYLLYSNGSNKISYNYLIQIFANTTMFIGNMGLLKLFLVGQNNCCFLLEYPSVILYDGLKKAILSLLKFSSDNDKIKQYEQKTLHFQAQNTQNYFNLKE